MAGSILLLALAAMPEPAAYPAALVWDRAVKFCASKTPASATWTPFRPQPGTSLAYLAEYPGEHLGARGKPAKVYRGEVAGRTLFAFKRQVADGPIGAGNCQIYDFEASERLVVADWAKVANVKPETKEPEYTQRLSFQLAERQPEAIGHILLRQSGYFPQPHSIGFVGIEIMIADSL